MMLHDMDRRKTVFSHMGGSIAQWLAFALPDPAAPGLIPDVPDFFPRIFSEKTLSMLPRLTDSAGA